MNRTTDMKKIFHDARISLQQSEDRIKSLTGSSSSPIPRLTAPGEMDIDIKMEPNKYSLRQDIDHRPAVQFDDSSTPMLSPSPRQRKGAEGLLSSRCILHGSGCSTTTPLGRDTSVASDSEAELVRNFQETRISNVDAWLDTVLSDGPNTSGRSLESPAFEANNLAPEWNFSHHGKFLSRMLLETGSNKENITPSSGTSWETTSSECGHEESRKRYKPQRRRRSFSEHSSRRSIDSGVKHIPRITTPILLRKTQPSRHVPTIQARVTNYIVPDKPRGYFSLPPRRKKMRSALTPMPPRTDTNYDTSQPFEIAEDEDAEAEIAELSPNVMRFRKGKEPKRPRCASYFDGDLFSKTKKEVQSDDKKRNLRGVSEGGRTVLGDITHDPNGDSADGDASGEGELESCDTSEDS